MRILVLSDTHGHLELVNKLVEKHKADCVIHCGDFGIESSDRLLQTPQRELTLRIRHAPPSVNLPPNARKDCFKMSKDEKIELIKQHNLLGEFDGFLQGSARFTVPVYCVWGNHEDDELVQRLRSKQVVVPNLVMVDGCEGVLLDGWIRLVGVGGNLIHWLFFDNEQPAATIDLPPSQPSSTAPSPNPTGHSIPPVHSFYPSMRFSEWARMMERFNVTNPPRDKTKDKNKDKDKDKDKDKVKASSGTHAPLDSEAEQLWLVTHISPGKEPTLEWLMFLLHPTFVFSGHMGPYLPQHYSMFTVMDDGEWIARVSSDLVFVKSVWDERKWSFDMWYFALDLVTKQQATTDVESIEHSTGDNSTTDKNDSSNNVSTNDNNKDYLHQWTQKFEEATFEREPGVKTKLTDLYFDEVTLRALKSSNSASELGNKIISLFVSQQPPDDSVNLPSSKGKKTTLPFPNPRVIPPKDSLAWLAGKVDELLTVPQQLRPKPPQSASEGFLRKPSDLVKQAPQFFNLPDAYMGGYILVDTNAASRTLSFTSIGSYPPSHIV